jgi:hypothetical protein
MQGEIAQINEILRTCWTERGVELWWDRPRHQLGGRTPREALADDPKVVLALAEAGRSQQGT